MKASILFALIASTLLTSACGRDSKKSQPKSTVYHFYTGIGPCLELVKENISAPGEEVPADAVPGHCPEKMMLQGATITRYATCSKTYDNVPMTMVFYTKMMDEEGGVMDLTLITPQEICEALSED